MLVAMKDKTIIDTDHVPELLRMAEAVADEYEDAIGTHIYDEGEEPRNAPERKIIRNLRRAIRKVRVK